MGFLVSVVFELKNIEKFLPIAAKYLQTHFLSISIPDFSPEALPNALCVGVYKNETRETNWVSLPREGSFCAGVMREAKLLSVQRMGSQEEKRICDLMQEDSAFAYLGAPIPAITGGAIGTLAALHKGARIWSHQNEGDLTEIAAEIGLELVPAGMLKADNIALFYP